MTPHHVLSLTDEQAYSSSWIYQITRLLGEFNASRRTSRRILLDALYGPLELHEDYPFYFLPRDWRQSSAHSVNFTYFKHSSLWEDEAQLRKTFREHPEATAFLESVANSATTVTVRSAATDLLSWLEREGGLEGVRPHHNLLTIYSSCAVCGAIPGALAGFLFDFHDSAKSTWFVVRTISETVNASKLLPDLDIWTVASAKAEVDGRALTWATLLRKSLEQPAPRLVEHYAHQIGWSFLDQLVRGTYQEVPSARIPDRAIADNYLIFIPLFKWLHRRGEAPAGSFLGWLFQYLPGLPEFDSESKGKAFCDYRLGLLEALPDLCTRLQDLASREATVQVGMDSLRVHAKALQAPDDLSAAALLMKVLGQTGAWDEAEVLRASVQLTDYVEVDLEKHEVRVSLRPSPLDAPDDVAIASDSCDDARCVLRLRSSRSKEFVWPTDEGHPYFRALARRVRGIYREAVVIERRQKQAEHALRADLSYTFAHALRKLASSVRQGSNDLVVPKLVDDARRYLDGYLRSGPEGEAAEKAHKSLSLAAKRLAGDPRQAVASYFFQILDAFADASIILQRAGARALRPGERMKETLAQYLGRLFEEVVVPAGQFMEMGRVQETIRKHLAWGNRSAHDLLTTDRTLDTLRLRTIQDRDPALVTVFETLLDLAFVELFLNALSDHGLLNVEPSDRAKIALRWDSEHNTLIVENPCQLKSGGHYGPQLIEPPRESRGTRGWGVFGCRQTLVHILHLATDLRANLAESDAGPSACLGRFEIDFSSDWISREDSTR